MPARKTSLYHVSDYNKYIRRESRKAVKHIDEEEHASAMKLIRGLKPPSIEVTGSLPKEHSKEINKHLSTISEALKHLHGTYTSIEKEKVRFETGKTLQDALDKKDWELIKEHLSTIVGASNFLRRRLEEIKSKS